MRYKKNTVRRIATLFVILFICSLACFFVIRGYMINLAYSKIDSMIADAERADNGDPDQIIVALTKNIHDNFAESSPRSFFLHRLEPYLSNARLPNFIRFPKGVIDILVMHGMCDSAARAQILAFKRLGFHAVQWDMVTNQYAHSAVMVTTSTGKDVLVDPFHGVVGYGRGEHDNGSIELFSPSDIKQIVSDGGDILNHLKILSKTSEYAFYNELGNARMGQFGNSLILDATIPEFQENRLILGEIDGSGEDVKNASSKYGMTPFWYYAGHRFDRSWIRQLRTKQDITVTFILTDNVEDGIITSDKIPDINENQMSWSLKAGERLNFYDGKAKINWQRLNSYIPIDKIVFEKN